MSMTALTKKHPVWAYFVLTFAISWGGFVLVVGPDGFPGDPSQFEKLLPFVAWSMLAGPSIAGLLLTGLVDGTRGYRELFSRLCKWRVGLGWYALALLPAPIMTGGILVALSLSSPIFSSPDKWAVLVPAVVAGLSTILEEIGWTGFAVPKLRKRFSILGTSLIVGALWGAWHFLQILWVSSTYSGTVPAGLFLLLYVLSGTAGLTAYRVLLVWMHDRTGSLFLTTLMHASLSACNVFIFRPDATGVTFVTYGAFLVAAEWLAVAMVAAFDRGRLSRSPQHH